MDHHTRQRQPRTMSWHRISEAQLFTHSSISTAGPTSLFCIEDDERALREEWHTEADLRRAVLKKVLSSLTKRETPAARGTTTAAARTEEWLKMCGDKAVNELQSLSLRKDAPKLEVKVQRSRTGAVQDRICQDLDVGARIIGVAPGRDQELSELAGHLLLLPSLGARGNFYLVLANPKNELELFGLVPVLPAELTAPPRTRTRVANSKTTIVTRPDRGQCPSNRFACLQGDEATVTAQALAAADRDAEIVEEVDLHGKTLSEAIEQVRGS